MQTRLNLFTAVILAGTIGSAIMTASPAIAQDDNDIVVRGIPEGTEMERVSYRDLDLRLIAHLNILNERVDRAVRNVCDLEPGTRMDQMTESYRNCATGAWAGARPQMHRAYLRANRLALR